MSRAFVKEESDAPPPPPLERPVSNAPNRVTPRGLRLIEEEVARIETALADGPDDGQAALLRRDLRYWTTRRASAQPVPPDPAPEAAGFGTRLTIKRGGAVSEIESSARTRPIPRRAGSPGPHRSPARSTGPSRARRSSSPPEAGRNRSN